MLPDHLALGHLLAALAVLSALVAIAFLVSAAAHRGHGYGTPGYARSRTARRKALYAAVAALILGGACLTPLCDVPLISGPAA